MSSRRENRRLDAQDVRFAGSDRRGSSHDRGGLDGNASEQRGACEAFYGKQALSNDIRTA